MCPGCLKPVSPMERGVVPGPQGSKWHGGCLICGGAAAKGKRKVPGKAGCAKKLDSGAKLDAEGSVWCRECLVSFDLFTFDLRYSSESLLAFASPSSTSSVSRQNTYCSC